MACVYFVLALRAEIEKGMWRSTMTPLLCGLWDLAGTFDAVKSVFKQFFMKLPG